MAVKARERCRARAAPSRVFEQFRRHALAALLLGDAGMTASTHLVTFATYRRRFVLRGDGADLASHALTRLPSQCPGTSVDCALVLPDRVYAIVRVPNAGALPALVQTYKAELTRALKRQAAIDRVWEKGYAQRVIADEAELISVRAMLRCYGCAT